MVQFYQKKLQASCLHPSIKRTRQVFSIISMYLIDLYYHNHICCPNIYFKFYINGRKIRINELLISEIFDYLTYFLNLDGIFIEYLVHLLLLYLQLLHIVLNIFQLCILGCWFQGKSKFCF